MHTTGTPARNRHAHDVAHQAENHGAEPSGGHALVGRSRRRCIAPRRSGVRVPLAPLPEIPAIRKPASFPGCPTNRSSKARPSAALDFTRCRDRAGDRARDRVSGRAASRRRGCAGTVNPGRPRSHGARVCRRGAVDRVSRRRATNVPLHRCGVPRPTRGLTRRSIWFPCCIRGPPSRGSSPRGARGFNSRPRTLPAGADEAGRTAAQSSNEISDNLGCARRRVTSTGGTCAARDATGHPAPMAGARPQQPDPGPAAPVVRGNRHTLRGGRSRRPGGGSAFACPRARAAQDGTFLERRQWT